MNLDDLIVDLGADLRLLGRQREVAVLARDMVALAQAHGFDVNAQVFRGRAEPRVDLALTVFMPAPEVPAPEPEPEISLIEEPQNVPEFLQPCGAGAGAGRDKPVSGADVDHAGGHCPARDDQPRRPVICDRDARADQPDAGRQPPAGVTGRAKAREWTPEEEA